MHQRYLEEASERAVYYIILLDIFVVYLGYYPLNNHQQLPVQMGVGLQTKHFLDYLRGIIHY